MVSIDCDNTRDEKMSERMRESLSALMDGESNELELQRILSGIGEDAMLRQTWVRYHAVRTAVSGGGLTDLSLDISQRVREALVEEGNRHAGSTVRRLLKPLASFAVAASVAAVVVIGGLQISRIDDNSSYPAPGTLAGFSSPVWLLNGLGATPVYASYGTRGIPVLQPAARTAYRELARQRMQKYMQAHAEQAALNSPQGLVPFVRVREITE
jgi:sigma-E factor negative regulatory protein RseA